MPGDRLAVCGCSEERGDPDNVLQQEGDWNYLKTPMEGEFLSNIA